jgi:exonuclease III
MLRKLRLERANAQKWSKAQKKEEVIRVASWNVNGLQSTAKDIMTQSQLALIRPIADVVMIQESHLTRKWEPEIIDGLKFDIQQNRDLSSIKGGLITMCRKITMEGQRLVESYRRNMLVTQIMKEHRNIILFNLYV